MGPIVCRRTGRAWSLHRFEAEQRGLIPLPQHERRPSGAGAPSLGDTSFRGAGAMLPIATLLVLAFGIGAMCDELGTGPFVAAQVTPYPTPLLVAPLVFLVSGAIATGTIWGTFAIMIPLAAAAGSVLLSLVAGLLALGWRTGRV